jgi:hypothetical protein
LLCLVAYFFSLVFAFWLDFSVQTLGAWRAFLYAETGDFEPRLSEVVKEADDARVAFVPVTGAVPSRLVRGLIATLRVMNASYVAVFTRSLHQFFLSRRTRLWALFWVAASADG